MCPLAMDLWATQSSSYTEVCSSGVCFIDADTVWETLMQPSGNHMECTVGKEETSPSTQ